MQRTCDGGPIDDGSGGEVPKRGEGLVNTERWRKVDGTGKTRVMMTMTGCKKGDRRVDLL